MADFEDMTNKILRYVERIETINFDLRELEEQFDHETSAGSGDCIMQIAKRQEMREAKRSSRSSDKKRMSCISPVWPSGIHN